jgi:hypothetical protein
MVIDVNPASTLAPERWLLLAILAQAAKDVHSRDATVAQDAAQWIASAACNQLCALLNYDTRLVREFAAQRAR